MSVISIASLAIATTLGLAASATDPPPTEPTSTDCDEMAIRQGTWEMTRPNADSWTPRRFEVRTTTVVRDPDGTPVGDSLHGRICMIRAENGVKLAVERWGGGSSYVRSIFDGKTMTWLVPSTRDFERSFPTAEDDIQDACGPEDWSWLQSAEFVTRIGPASSHLLDILYFEGFQDFEVTEGPNPVDLGPTQAIAFTGRPAPWRQTGSEPETVHVALSDHPLGFPLAVAARMPDGRTIEFEYHDWAIETADQTIGSFGPADPTQFASNLPADWTEVMSIRIPGVDAPDLDDHARFTGRLAAPTVIDANLASAFDVFEGDGPVAVLFHHADDPDSMEQLISATSGFELDIHGVRVAEGPHRGGPWISPKTLDRIWGFRRLPALVIIDDNRTVLEARSPWFGPAGRPATEPTVATVHQSPE